MKMIFAGALIVVAGAIASACSSDRQRVTGGDIPEWSVSPTSTLTIGHEGDPHYEFVRIAGIATLNDGSVVVADAGAHELRIYDAGGQFVRSLGRSGPGPGEFQGGPGNTRVMNDVILTLESSLRAAARFQVFDAVRGYMNGVTVRPDTPAVVTPRAILTSGALLVSPGPAMQVVKTVPPENTVVRDSTTLGILHVGDPQVVTWLGTFPSHCAYSFPFPPLAGAPGRRAPGYYSLGPNLVTGASGDRVWLGDSGTGEIVLYDTTGTEVARTEFPLPPRPFDEAALAEAEKAALAQIAGLDSLAQRISSPSTEELYSPALRPPTAPRFTRFTAGPDGEMWVECYSEITTAAHCAYVFDASGDVMARATIPADLRVEAVERDRMIGIVQNADGVERIAIHRLTR